jgi:cobalt-zinc-cadmium efflux system protein
MFANHFPSSLNDTTDQTRKRLALSSGLTAAFVFVEIIAGVYGNSLALLTDAAHNVTDVIALGLSWYAVKISTQPSHAGKTYGYHRVGILVALVNSTTLILIALGIFFEAYQRFLLPSKVNAPILISVGILAFLINFGTAWLVKHGSENDLNLRSTFVHLMGDVLSTIGAVIAGIIIAYTNWNWLDPFVSVLIGMFILWNAVTILRQSIHILLESTPERIDITSLIDDLRHVDGVLDVHDLHVWSINENLCALSAHVTTDDFLVSAGLPIQQKVTELLTHKYNIRHATLQLECEGCANNLLFCDIAELEHHQ